MLTNTTFSRRRMLQNSGCGFASLALAGLCAGEAAAARNPLAVKPPHHTPRAKRVIFLFMHGGPSQVDTFDYKPRLEKDDGSDLPFAPTAGLDAKTKRLMKSPWKFKQYGESGMHVSELFPHVAEHVDELSFIHSLHTNGVSHGQAVSMLHTGSDSQVRPSVGAWTSYGLGTENSDLPSFVSITPPRGHGGPRNYGAAFLPAAHQATALGHSQMKVADARIAHLAALGVSRKEQRQQLDLLRAMNRKHLARAGQDEQIEGVIESFELAFRMQAEVPKVTDLSQESQATQSLYGMDEKPTENFGRACLLALAVDKPIAGLLSDLRTRGLLEDTLVWWGGEFGRTPIVQGKNGRDHNPQGFTQWLAGGGVKEGFRYGATDEFGYKAAIDKVHMHDLHATVLNLLGLDHEQLTYRYGGREFRLTDVYGRVVEELMA
jgi:hypothetical protein